MDHQTSSTKQRGKATFWKYINILVIILFIVIVVVVSITFELEDLQNFVNHDQKLAIIISWMFIFIASLAFVPTIPITLFLTALMGPIPAIIVSGLGNSLSAMVHYQVGKQLGDIFNFEEKKAKLPFNLGKLPMNSPILLLVGRAIPGGPKGLSFISGAYHVPYLLYLWTTCFTNFIGAAFVAFGSDRLIKLW